MNARLRLSLPHLCRGSWFAACVSLTLMKLWLVAAQTVFVLTPNSIDDDLFLYSASSVLRGEWLGPLTHLTLAKGPVYPLWLALNNLTGTRLLLAQALLYVIACVVLVRAVRFILQEPWRRALLYLAILFNPASWADGPATRVIREGIYPSLSVLLLGLAIGSALRMRSSPGAAALWAAAAGFAGALFAMTREEGIWLVPSLAVVLMLAVASSMSRGWRKTIIPLAAAAVAYVLPTSAVAVVNWKHYDVFGTCEFRERYFTSAYGALTRVQTSSWDPHVPVSREARALLYQASPAFREIQPYLEGSAAIWTSYGCKYMEVCDDIAGGWFMWAFRAAASDAGKYQDGHFARTWYEQVTREVDDACRDGRLECLSARTTLMPPWSVAYLGPLSDALARSAVFASTFEEVSPYPTAPAGDAEGLAWYARVTNEQIPRPFVAMHGTVESRVGPVSAIVVDSRLKEAAASIRRAAPLQTEQIAERSGSTTRLSIETTCVSDCQLALFTDDRRAVVVPLDDNPGTVGGADLRWTTEGFQRRTMASADTPSRMRRLAVLEKITRVYQQVTPPLLALAIATLLWRFGHALRARSFPAASLIALALLVGIAVRLLLVSLVEVTSFPAINLLYLAPAYPLMLAFIVLVLLSRPEGQPGSPAGS